MAVEYRAMRRRDLGASDLDALTRVESLAQRLLAELRLRDDDIDRAHVHNAQSKAVQNIVAEILRDELDFDEEFVLPLDNGIVTRPRPDFYFDLGGRRGVLAEVERGGTVTNNHDLKDVWKTHIAPRAQHLFLVVPNSNWTLAGGSRERPFARVVNRVGAFFGDPRREIDVISCHVFGYGRWA